jgi:Zn-dependent protease with chaperone function
MSETTATSTTTVFRVARPHAFFLLTLASAEAGVRLLTPRAAPPTSTPADIRAYFSAEEIRRGARFARPQLGLAMARSAVELGALVAVARRPPRWLSRLRSRPLAGSALAGAGLAAALSLPPLPLAMISRRRALAVGLATQSWKGWAVDLAKATTIEAGLSGAAGVAVTAATRRYPRGWWGVMAVGSVAVGALFAALAPVLLDPVFNDYEPLPEGQLRSDVLTLATAAGVKVGEVYSVDASRRTTAANAYVTGLGPTKRVVLFDTLVDRYDRDQVRVVVAHELAHVRHRDVPRGVAYGALVAPAAALAIQRLSWALSAERGTPAALPALALAAALVTAPMGLVGNRLSRAVERRADAYSLELTGASDAFVSFERQIALQNIADLDPPRWVSALGTHPPTAERIALALDYASR